MKDHFSSYHPVVNFGYFFMVIFCSMFFLHPAFLTIGLVSSFCYSIYLKGRKALIFNILYLLPMLGFVAVINPIFNHGGLTILFYLENGNPITLESICFGVASSVMLVTVILWFSCYNEVMTSEKFIYLFGRIIPSLSLIFSMVLRFVPRYKAQIFAISQAQQSIGRDVSQGSLWERGRNAMRILSIMTTWALENAIETADSMKSRGYGLPGRTSFSLYRFDARDRGAVAVMVILFLLIMGGAMNGMTAMEYFPGMRMKPFGYYSVIIYGAYFMLCMVPMAINIREEWKWKSISLVE